MGIFLPKLCNKYYCPRKSTYGTKLSTFFLFCFIMSLLSDEAGFTWLHARVTTRVRNQRQRLFVFNRMTRRAWGFNMSTTMNKMCYSTLIGAIFCTFLIYDKVRELLLSSVAMQFIIEADEVFANVVFAEGERDRLRKRLLLRWLLEGEKTPTDVTNNFCY